MRSRRRRAPRDPTRREAPALLAEGPGCAGRSRGSGPGVARRTASRGSGTSSTRSPASRANRRRRGSSSTAASANRSPPSTTASRSSACARRTRDGDVGRGVVGHARLAFAAALEAPLALPAGAGAALDVARADLRRDEPLAREDAHRVAAEADEQHADDAVARGVREQRLGVEGRRRAGVRPAAGTAARTRRVAPSAPVNVTRPGRVSVRTSAVLAVPALEPRARAARAGPRRSLTRRARRAAPRARRAARRPRARACPGARRAAAAVGRRRRRRPAPRAPAGHVGRVEVVGQPVAEALLLLARAARELARRSPVDQAGEAVLELVRCRRTAACARCAA